MSNFSGTPPASLVHATAKAAVQDIVIRLIHLPDNLRNNDRHIKMTGTVLGQNPDGSVQLSTDRGTISMMLKDKGNLPVGQKFEIDIPAGRPPQQAALRTASPESAVPATPHLQIPTGGTTTTPRPDSANLRLDHPQVISQGDLAEALSSLAPGQELRTAAPLQAGQILRLIPLPLMAQGNAPILPTGSFDPEMLFSSLMKMIDQAVDLPIQIRQNLAQLLSRIDLTTLLPPTESEAGPEAPPPLMQSFQKLIQSLDLPPSIQLRNSQSPDGLQNMPATLFNSARPMDIKILAFQNGNFQATLAQATSSQTSATPVPPASTQGATPPVLTPQNFVTAPQTQGAAQSTQNSPPAILGQVTGFTPQGQPIVSLALPGSPQPQNYAVQFVANNIVEGAPLIVTPLPLSASQQASLVPFAIGGGQSLASWAQPEIWDSLQTLIGTLGHINPGMAQSLAHMLPSAANPQNMGALSMFFLSVMRTGDIETWIGPPALNLLKQSGKIDILRQLAGESTVSNRLEQAPLPNEWRAAVFPFWNDGQVHKLPLYYKHWQDDRENGDQTIREKRMRFLFNLKLSRMGDVQVDGFLQKEKLDMILRTKSIISTNMQQAMKMTYTKAMERSNLAGEITFQFKPEQWVNIDMAPV